MAKEQESTPQDGTTKQKTVATPATKKATVTTEFHDKDDFNKVHEVGDTVEFGTDRIDGLVSLGLVKVEEPVDPNADGDPNKDKKSE